MLHISDISGHVTSVNKILKSRHLMRGTVNDCGKSTVSFDFQLFIIMICRFKFSIFKNF